MTKPTHTNAGWCNRYLESSASRMPYPFVLSYARQDARIDEHTADPHFALFIDRLNLRAKQLTGHENPGFVDTTNIQPGQDWPDELAESLRTAHTMVCLYSPAYFASEHCGKEMQVLLDRRSNYIRLYGGKKPSNIIPVLWQPVPWRIPKTLPDIQYKHENLDLTSQGVWNLGDSGQERQLLAVADQIALRVRDAADLTPLPALHERPRVAAVRSAFQPPPLPLPEFDTVDAAAGPNAVTFTYAASAHWDQWPWAPPAEHAVLYLAAAVAKGKEMVSTQLRFDATDANLATRLGVLRGRNNVVILFVDAATLDINGLSERLREFDRPEHLSFAIIVLMTITCPPEIRSKVGNIFSHSARRATPHFRIVEIDVFNYEAREQFSKVIADTIEQLRLAVVNDPYRSSEVVSRSHFPTLPTVTGPGQS